MITFDAGGTPVTGHVALAPVNGPAPGVLVLHPWWGLTPALAAWCDRLAAEGFVVLAPDLFGGRTAATAAEAEALAGQQDSSAVASIVAAALSTLGDHPAVRGPAVGVVGFSFGAAFALYASFRHADRVAAVAVYYGTAGEIDLTASRSAYLGHYAAADPYEPDEAVRGLGAALETAGRPAEIHRYAGVRHWFAEADRPEYDAAAAGSAWGRTVSFLARELRRDG